MNRLILAFTAKTPTPTGQVLLRLALTHSALLSFALLTSGCSFELDKATYNGGENLPKQGEENGEPDSGKKTPEEEDASGPNLTESPDDANKERSAKDPKNSTGDKDKSPTDGGKNPTDPNGKTTEEKYDLAYDTALDSCVAERVRPVKAIKLKSNIEDYSQLSQLSSEEKWFDLADLVIRSVVDADGLVDYEALRTTYKTQWQLLIKGLETLSLPDRSSHGEMIAKWTNAYNLTMMDIIVRDPSISNIETDGRWEVFKTPVKVMGQSLTLDQIEKGVLRLGRPEPVDAGLLIETKDVRLHAGLVCGAVSCPKLRNIIYRPENASELMNENFLMYVNSQKHFNFQGGALAVSKIVYSYYWSRDFKGYDLAAWALDTCRGDETAAFKDILNQGKRAWSGLNYDWTINAQN